MSLLAPSSVCRELTEKEVKGIYGVAENVTPTGPGSSQHWVANANLSVRPHKPGLRNHQGKGTRGDQVQLASHDTGLTALKGWW